MRAAQPKPMGRRVTWEDTAEGFQAASERQFRPPHGAPDPNMR